MKICGFAICRLANLRNLRDLRQRKRPKNFCGLAIFGLVYFTLTQTQLHSHTQYLLTLRRFYQLTHLHTGKYGILIIGGGGGNSLMSIVFAFHFDRMYYKKLIKSCYLIKKARKKHMYRLGDFGRCLNQDYFSVIVSLKKL